MSAGLLCRCLLPLRGCKYSNAAVITHQVSQHAVSHNLSSNRFKGPMCKIQRHSQFPSPLKHWEEQNIPQIPSTKFLFFFCPEVCVLKNILLVFCIWIWILLKNNMNILVPQMPKNKTKILNETFKILPSLIMSCLSCYLSYGLRKKHEDPVKIPSVLDTSECLFLAIKNTTTLWM